jgi:hypothetical protein
MKSVPTKDGIARGALRAGVAMPLIYFGTQLIGALFYPGYSFLTMDASTLGSDRSTMPWLFNAGVILTGLATAIAGFGFLLALKRLRANSVIAWLVCFALVQNGLATIWAGYFSLPDPRHNTGIYGAIGLLALPPLLLCAVWKQPSSAALKSYLFVTCLLALAFMSIMSGLIHLDTRSYAGLMQRAIALTLFSPVAIGAYSLLKRLAASSDPSAAIERAL